MSLPAYPAGEPGGKAEFDLLADRYAEQHAANIEITGEAPEYFAEYKIADLAKLVEARGLGARNIFDFGCGIGNSVPYFRKYFPESALTCGDASTRSIEIARQRFPGAEQYELISQHIPLPSKTQDIVFSACVFHHIPQDEHRHWLAELRRVTRPGGLLVIFEHNPLNPLTLRAVNTCPFDAKARLISGPAMRRQVIDGGWLQPRTEYKLFFPARLAALRRFEKHLGWFALGAQYRLAAICPDQAALPIP